ncbi:hypothetical protein [Pyruvatibacter sp.]|uniref:hypothetical protein n=1 Tax=Pyruvatibacter sp. TaxID=1981328 RepID=UPI0032ED3081
MPLDVAQAPFLLRSPFGGHLLVEGRVDGAVELVHIGGVDAVLEPVVFGAQFLDGFLVLAPLVGVAVVKGVAHPVQNLVVERQLAE